MLLAGVLCVDTRGKGLHRGLHGVHELATVDKPNHDPLNRMSLPSVILRSLSIRHISPSALHPFMHAQCIDLSDNFLVNLGWCRDSK
jgi:hypothetical protein